MIESLHRFRCTWTVRCQEDEDGKLQSADESEGRHTRDLEGDVSADNAMGPSRLRRNSSVFSDISLKVIHLAEREEESALLGFCA